MKKTLVLFLACFLLATGGQALTLKIEGTTDIEDSYIVSGASADKNYGGSISLAITSGQNLIIRVQNLSTLLPAGATITNLVCSLYCSVNSGDDTVYAYRVFKPWVEGTENGVDDDDGDVTWNDWASDAYEWGTAGGACAGDDGSDNSQDGTCDEDGRDRKATEECLTFVNTVDTWYAFEVSADLAQAWYEGTANENGIILTGYNLPTGSNWFTSSENPIAGQRPFWTITYTTAGGRRNREIRNLLRGEWNEEEHNPLCARIGPAICW